MEIDYIIELIKSSTLLLEKAVKAEKTDSIITIAETMKDYLDSFIRLMKD